MYTSARSSVTAFLLPRKFVRKATPIDVRKPLLTTAPANRSSASRRSLSKPPSVYNGEASDDTRGVNLFVLSNDECILPSAAWTSSARALRVARCRR